MNKKSLDVAVGERMVPAKLLARSVALELLVASGNMIISLQN